MNSQSSWLAGQISSLADITREAKEGTPMILHAQRLRGPPCSTASPARLLVMLCDRLVLDVQRGRSRPSRPATTRTPTSQLMHAQEIVTELRGTLRVEAVGRRPGAGTLYDWLHSQLVAGQHQRTLALTEGCLDLVDEPRATPGAAARRWPDRRSLPA